MVPIVVSTVPARLLPEGKETWEGQALSIDVAKCDRWTWLLLRAEDGSVHKIFLGEIECGVLGRALELAGKVT